MPAYTTLRAIRQRKDELARDINNDGKEMGRLWKSLFAKPAPVQRKGFSLQGLMGTGAGILDGAILAWKLYRKFKR